jgi:hypothetical protein
MDFLYPNFLFALGALAIPIIIHLFNFRRFKKVPFTNVRFLREIKIQTQSQNKLRHLLVLLARMLALAFLVFAFAQPYIPTDESQKKDQGKAVSIFIDNSFSMQGESEEGPLLEVAKNRAIDIAMAFEATDRFHLLSQDFKGSSQRFISRAAFIEQVGQIELSSRSRSAESIIRRQEDLLTEGDESYGKEAFIISDFQKTQYSIDEVSLDTSIAYNLVVLERNSPANLYIDSVWFPSPVRRQGENESLSVRIVNTGQAYVENVPLKLEINGKQKAIGSFAVNPQSSVDTTLSFSHETAGIKRATVSLEDYPVDYDDAYHMGYKVYDKLSVLSITESTDVGIDSRLKSVYEVDSSYAFREVVISQLDYGNLQSQDLIILNELEDIPGGLRQEITTYVQNGGSTWIIPSPNASLSDYDDLTSDLKAGSYSNLIEDAEMKVVFINAESDLYKDIFKSVPKNIDLPVAQVYFPIQSASADYEEKLLEFRGGLSFLSAYNALGGKVYLQAVPLRTEKNNFSRHAIFVATALRIAELSRETEVYSVSIGEEASFSIPYFKTKSEDVFHLSNAENGVDLIPAYQIADGRISLYTKSDLNQAGLYDLSLADSTITSIGFNHPRQESALDSYEGKELSEIIDSRGVKNLTIFDSSSEKLVKDIQQNISGQELWKFCLLLALVFFLLESVILRFFKRS